MIREDGAMAGRLTWYDVFDIAPDSSADDVQHALTPHVRVTERPKAGGAYDLSVATGMPAWREIGTRVAEELGEPVHDAQPLTPPRTSRMTWAARAPETGAIVVKARRG